jgi:hypothetical protein
MAAAATIGAAVEVTSEVTSLLTSEEESDEEELEELDELEEEEEEEVPSDFKAATAAIPAASFSRLPSFFLPSGCLAEASADSLSFLSFVL